MTDRQNERREWLSGIASKYALNVESEAPASSDAGFRSYFRVADQNGKTFIVMDAPPAHEDVRPFIRVTSLFEKAALTVPHIYEQSPEQGFLLLSDLGRETYLDVLNEDNARELMTEAIDALVRWQSISEPGVLPEYDRATLTRELNLFPEWYIAKHRNKILDERQSALLKVCFERILQNNLSQAKVFVHRDYMPRNLMVMPQGGPGILDYQDALYGPVSYDIASLLRDAFISWGETFVIDMTIRYWEKARQACIPVPQDFGVFWKDVEWMGLQRHLKILGIFARLNYRDNKSKYLADTPRFINYVCQTAHRYDELKALLFLVDQIEDSVPQYGYTF